MKILQINKYHYLRGGAERVFFNTCELLEAHGHEVAPFTIVHPQNEPSAYSDYFAHAPEIRNMGTLGRIKSMPRFFWNRHAAKQMERLINDFHPDVAHIHNLFNGISLSILPVLKRHNIPVVLTVHDPRLVCPSTFWGMKGDSCLTCHNKWYTECVINQCCDSLPISIMGMLEMIHKDKIYHYYRDIDRFIFLNNAFRDKMSSQYPEIRERADVLPNFSPNLELRESPKGNYLLIFGRLSVEKGLSTFIEAARLVPFINFVVAGDGPMRSELESSGLPNVHFTGFLSGDALSNAIEKSSFVLVPSECMENNPMTIIEAYSYGKPVIGTSLGGIPDMIENGRTGWIVPPYSPTEFAEAMRKAATIKDSQYASMSKRAREFASAHYNKDVHYERLMEIYGKAGERKGKILS